jgi:hypothetical protein
MNIKNPSRVLDEISQEHVQESWPGQKKEAGES